MQSELVRNHPERSARRRGASHLAPALLQGPLHDIRGIASTIALTAERLRASDEPSVREQADRLDTCVSRIVSVCEDALPRKAPGAGRDSLARVVNDAADLASTFAAPGAVVTVAVRTEMPIGACARPLFRILFNLATNAVHAVNDAGGGEVRLQVAEVDDVLFFEVSDDGGGIFADAVCGLTPVSEAVSRRHGLGLAIAERLARSMDAALFLGPSGRLGTTFHMIMERRRLSETDCMMA